MNQIFKSKLSSLAGILVAIAGLFAFADVINAQKKSGGPPRVLPVVLIHGIGGSDLRQDGKGLFSDGGFPNDVLKFKAGDPYKLQFDSTGNPRTDTMSSNIIAAGFYDVPLSKDITDLSDHFRKNGYPIDQLVFEFAYDFRYSVPYNAAKLGELIERIKLSTKAERVDIVGHSMGGLIAKSYLVDSANAANVRNLIFVGTPHLGAPKALKALRYGDDLDVAIIDGCKLKRAVHNMPGMMNLLPGKRYFEMRGGYFLDDDDLDGDSVRGLLGYEQMTFNLKNGRETKCPLKPEVDFTAADKELPTDRLHGGLIDSHAIAFHETLDYWKKPENVTVINIVGYGAKTVEKIRESGGVVSLEHTMEGDGTVPLWSAETVESDFIYYVDVGRFKYEHSTMIGKKSFRLQILSLLTKGPGIYIENTSEQRPKKLVL
jgi:pimeloyl-ACP methyl ester carboxylesterase